MSDHQRPEGPHTPPREPIIFMVPEPPAGFVTVCECNHCADARYDDAFAHYSAHDMSDAWKTGWSDGFAAGLAYEPETGP